MKRTNRRFWVLGAGFAVLTLATAFPLGAQQASLDPRWQPWLGCWEPVPPEGQLLPLHVPRTCVIPAAGSSAVEFVAVVEGRVASRERVEASSERREVTGNCTGWERASWSDAGLRLYRNAEQTCGAAPLRRVTSVTAITKGGEWLEVQSVSAGRGSLVRVRRFREAPVGALLPDEVQVALRDVMSTVTAARVDASARLQLPDVIEAAAHVDSSVVEAWLAETGQAFDLNGRRLEQLSRAGVSGGAIDMMVALSNPGVFAISTARRVEIAARDSARTQGSWLYPTLMNTSSPHSSSSYSSLACDRYGWDPFGLGYAWENDNRYNYNYGPGTDCGRGRGFGYGWIGNGRPVIMLAGSAGTGGSASKPHGRVTRGGGYSSGTTGTSTRAARPSDSGSGSTRSAPSPGSNGDGGSSAGSGGYSGGSGSGSTTSTSEGRTAKPRP